MAITKTNNAVQVIIGTGTPTSGDLVEGGIGISLSADGKFVGLYTSSNGTNIIRLEAVSAEVQSLLDGKLDKTAQAVDSAKLGGKTQAEITTAIVNQITNGAGEAYDTLKELEDAIKSNDTDLATILATQANKVDKVNGKSLVDDNEIAKLASMNIRDDVRATGSTGEDLVKETGIREAIELAIPKIYKY